MDTLTTLGLLVASAAGVAVGWQLRGSSYRPVTQRDLREMEHRLRMNSQQLEGLLNNQTTQIGKIAKEQSDRFDVLTAKVKELTDLIAAGGEITPAIETAATAVQSALDNLDASIPDAPA